MAWERTAVGLDVHARSVVAGVLDTVTGQLWSRRLPAATRAVVSWVGSLPGPVAVAYEAGPAGFGLARALQAAGVGCVVVAPSKLERPPGDRVKTDRRDAERLARLLHIGELPQVRVPTEAEEAAQDLVRAREDARADLMRARHRPSKLLLRHGLVFEAAAWTQAHERWLGQLRFAQVGLRVAFDEAHGAVLAVQARRDRLDAAIAELATTPPWAPLVSRLGCLRGVGVLTAFGLAVEVGDWRRFTAPPSAPTWGWSHLGSPAVPACPGVDHQDRQRPCPTVVGRGGLAPPQTLSAKPGTPRPSPATARCGQRAGRRGQPPALSALVPAGHPGQALHHQRGRGRSRAGWMVLEPGRPRGLTDTEQAGGWHSPARERPATHL
jgi:transposase